MRLAPFGFVPLLSLPFIPSLPGESTGGGVFVVDALDRPGADFVDIELALQTVPPESVLLVRATEVPGADYPAITIDKPLVLIGEHEPDFPTIDVVGVSGSPVVLSRLKAGRIDVSSCSSTVIGEYLNVAIGSFPASNPPGRMLIDDSSDVRLRKVTTGDIRAVESRVEIVESTVEGTTINTEFGFGYGVEGVSAESSVVIIVASDVRGGLGFEKQSFPPLGFQFDGGDAVSVGTGSSVGIRVRREQEIVAGQTQILSSSSPTYFSALAIHTFGILGPAGVARRSGGTVIPPEAVQGNVKVPILRDPFLTVELSDDDADFTLNGEPGDIALLLIGSSAVQGKTQFGLRDLLTSGETMVPMGVVGFNGVASATVPLPDAPGGTLTFAQAMTQSPMSLVPVPRTSNSVVLVQPLGEGDFVSPCVIAPLDPVELGVPKAFDGSTASTGGAPIVDWHWDFGDGTTASGPTPAHAWSSAGSFPVMLTTTDSDGTSYTCTVNQQVLDLSTPCVIGPTDLAHTGVPTAFNGSQSYVSGGIIVDWQWDFGDGGTGSGPMPTHVYTTGGTKTVTLTTTASTDLVSTCTTTQDVNASPLCGIDVALDPSGPTAVLDSAPSIDPDGSITSTVWDLGDGSSSTQASVAHTYPGPGVYTVTLTVTDDDGAVATCSATVDLEEPCVISPVGVVDVGEPQVLDGSLSSAGGASTVSWEWDFGDGATASGPVVSHAWTGSGAYTVRLTTTDSNGSVASCSVVQEVNDPPVCGIELVMVFPGGFALLESTGSLDPDGSIVGYLWDMGDGTTYPTSDAFHPYGAPGTYTVTLTVTDDDGSSASCSEAVVVP